MSGKQLRAEYERLARQIADALADKEMAAFQSRELLQQLARTGSAGVVIDLPAAWIAAAAPAVALPLVNAGEPAESARSGSCLPHLFHTLPGERMRADAIAQALLARRWTRVMAGLLYDVTPSDPATFATVAALLAATALAACCGPALKAARVVS